MPKQLMPLISTRSLLQDTLLRLNGSDQIAAPVIISNADHRFIIAAQLQEPSIKPLVHTLQPVGRNTAIPLLLGL
jgi:mannose-1-phosphate guanylyltransferase